jgi:hypothetical protein
MPVDFDDEDIADVIEEVEDPKEESTIQPQVEEMSVEEQMSEVETRLEVAQYYKLILNDTLFDDPPNVEIAEQVEEEIRGFIKTRMQALMGVVEKPKAPQKIFADAEVQALRTLAQPEVVSALKALAAKVLKKPAILDAKPLPQEKGEEAPKVRREPMLKKVGQRPRQPQQQQPQAPVGRGRTQKKQFKTVVSAEGKEVKMDVTPQAQPVGPIQPIPTPRSKSQIEAMSAQSAYQQAHAAMQTLERKLRGKE